MSEERHAPRTNAAAYNVGGSYNEWNGELIPDEWVVAMDFAEDLERESDARAERIEELERENAAFRDYAPQRLPELILKLQRADELESENAKLREAAEELVSFFPMEPEHREYLRQRHGLVFIDRLERMRQALAGKEGA